MEFRVGLNAAIAGCTEESLERAKVCSRKNEQMERGLPAAEWPGSLAAPMTMLKKILKDRRFHRLAAVGLVLGVGALLLAWKMGLDGAMLKAGWKATENFLKERPWLLFAGLVFLPGLPVPMSLLFVTAGVVWREHPFSACMICLLAMALNQSWTYWLAAGPARKLVEKLLEKTSFKIPELPRGDHLKLILVLRLTPGIPLFFQNYLLGFLRAPFLLYLPISILCTGVIGCGVILSSAGLADGKVKWAITGVSLIVIGAVLTHAIRGGLARRKRAVNGAQEG